MEWEIVGWKISFCAENCMRNTPTRPRRPQPPAPTSSLIRQWTLCLDLAFGFCTSGDWPLKKRPNAWKLTSKTAPRDLIAAKRCEEKKPGVLLRMNGIPTKASSETRGSSNIFFAKQNFHSSCFKRPTMRHGVLMRKLVYTGACHVDVWL